MKPRLFLISAIGILFLVSLCRLADGAVTVYIGPPGPGPGGSNMDLSTPSNFAYTDLGGSGTDTLTESDPGHSLVETATYGTVGSSFVISDNWYSAVSMPGSDSFSQNGGVGIWFHVDSDSTYAFSGSLTSTVNSLAANSTTYFMELDDGTPSLPTSLAIFQDQSDPSGGVLNSTNTLTLPQGLYGFGTSTGTLLAGHDYAWSASGTFDQLGPINEATALVMTLTITPSASGSPVPEPATFLTWSALIVIGLSWSTWHRRQYKGAR